MFLELELDNRLTSIEPRTRHVPSDVCMLGWPSDWPYVS